MSEGVAAIKTRGLTKRFGGKLAVDRVELELERGSVCGLVGANGAGKTTTLSMLIGLYPPTSGQIEVLGINPSLDPIGVRQRIGYVPEKHNIYDWMKIDSVLDFASEIYPRWETRECDRVLEILRLPRDRRVRDLSRGELAKLALTIALSHKPELLVLDEPTAGLDPVVRQEFLEAVIAVLENRDRSVLFSSHILSDVERIADRVVALDRGRVVADTTIDALRDRFKRIVFLFQNEPPEGHGVPGAIRVERRGREWTVFAEIANRDLVERAAQEMGATTRTESVSIEDAIIELIRGAAC